MEDGIKRASAATKRKRSPVRGRATVTEALLVTLTPEERATLEPLIVRATVAAVAQSKAEAAYDKATASHATQAQRDRAMRIGGVAEDAQRKTCAAGAALAKALRALRGAK